MKTVKIDIRSTENKRTRYKAAARVMSVSLSDFMHRAATALADRVLTPGSNAEVVVRYTEGIEDVFQLPPEVDSGNVHEVARFLLLAVYERGGNALDLAAAEWEVREKP